jgi:hypothetical protein
VGSGSLERGGLHVQLGLVGCRHGSGTIFTQTTVQQTAIITVKGDGWQVVMAFLVGMGDEEPLRYRILPVNRFMNIGQADVATPV